MKVYIILAHGYEDGSEIEGVYANADDALDAIRQLRHEQDPMDDWLRYEIQVMEVIE